MVLRPRFMAAYGLLAVTLVTSGTATWRQVGHHRPGPLAPGAVALVQTFLGAIQHGDLKTACVLFSSFPACDPTVTPPALTQFEVFPAELAVDGVDVPATLNSQYALFTISEHFGRYRIVDVVADPSAFSSVSLPPVA